MQSFLAIFCALLVVTVLSFRPLTSSTRITFATQRFGMKGSGRSSRVNSALAMSGLVGIPDSYYNNNTHNNEEEGGGEEEEEEEEDDDDDDDDDETALLLDGDVLDDDLPGKRASTNKLRVL